MNIAEGVTNTATQSLDVSQAEDIIGGLLREEDEADTGNVEETVEEESETEEENTEAQPEADDAEEAEEQDAEEEFEDEADSVDEEATEEDVDETNQSLFTITENGEEFEVSEQELINGYTRQAAFDRKMNEVKTNGIQEIEQVKGQHIQARDEYARRVANLEQQLSEYVEQEPNWAELYEYEPLEAVHGRQEWNAKKEKYEAVKLERQKMQHQQQLEEQERLEKFYAEDRNKVSERIIEWKDQEIMKKELPLIKSYALTDAEYTEQEISIADTRAIRVLRKAMLYDKLMSNKGKAATKVKNKPKVIKSGIANTTPSKTKQFKAKFNQLKTSGAMEDAEKLVMDLL